VTRLTLLILSLYHHDLCGLSLTGNSACGGHCTVRTARARFRFRCLLARAELAVYHGFSAAPASHLQRRTNSSSLVLRTLPGRWGELLPDSICLRQRGHARFAHSPPTPTPNHGRDPMEGRGPLQKRPGLSFWSRGLLPLLRLHRSEVLALLASVALRPLLPAA